MTNTYFNKDHLQQAIQSPPPIVLMKGFWMEIEDEVEGKVFVTRVVSYRGKIWIVGMEEL